MERMRISAFVASLAILGCAFAACSDGLPPPISDSDASPPPRVDSGPVAPCASPAPGCPCADAGAQVSCGLVYRISGTHVDCSPGYLTCEVDGGWSDCVGASIYDGQ
jgi:hypothetical protein